MYLRLSWRCPRRRIPTLFKRADLYHAGTPSWKLVWWFELYGLSSSIKTYNNCNCTRMNLNNLGLCLLTLISVLLISMKWRQFIGPNLVILKQYLVKAWLLWSKQFITCSVNFFISSGHFLRCRFNAILRTVEMLIFLVNLRREGKPGLCSGPTRWLRPHLSIHPSVACMCPP